MNSTDISTSANPASEGPRLSLENLYTLRYFWEEKHDLTRWTGFEQALPALRNDRPDILAAWAAYLAAVQQMHEVVQSDDRVDGVAGARGPIEIVADEHEEFVEFRVNGESAGRFSYDAHGSSGMSSAEDLVRRLAAGLGLQVVESEGDE